MLKRVDRLSQWVMWLSGPAGLAVMLPLASYAYAQMGGFVFEPLLWYSGVMYFGIHQQTVLLSGIAGVVGGLAVPVFVVFLLLPPKPLHGAARLARTGEIKRARLYEIGPHSILLGRHRGRLLAFNGDLHAFLAASTGTGKGVGFVIPNLLHWQGSAIVLDIKGENYTITSGFRGRTLGQKVFRFDPLQEKGHTHCFNPLAYVREGELRITDVQMIASILVPAEGNDPYWANTARDLLIGLILLVVEAGPVVGWPVTIGQVHLLVRTEKESGAYLKGLLADLQEKKVAVSDLCRRYILSFCSEPDKPRGSIKSTLVTKLTLWANPLIDRATSRNDFDLREFRREAMTLYLAIAPDDLTRLSAVVRLLIEFFLSVNTKAGETPVDIPALKVPVLLLLDEFLSLGKLEKLVQALAYVRGWGIKIATVIQSEAQLKAVYGLELAEFFVDNHRARVYYRPPVHRRDLAEGISKVIGMTTVKQTSYSYSRGRRTRNVSETGQAILNADEIANLRDTETIILVEGIRALIGQKIIYYRDRIFKKRRLPALGLPAAVVAAVAGAVGVAEAGSVERADDPQERYLSAADVRAALDAIPTPRGMPTAEQLTELARSVAVVMFEAAPEALAEVADAPIVCGYGEHA